MGPAAHIPVLARENISATAAAAREPARTSSGRFGTRARPDVELDLTGKRTPSTECPYELFDGASRIRENVTVDARLRRLPSYRDPMYCSGLRSCGRPIATPARVDAGR